MVTRLGIDLCRLGIRLTQCKKLQCTAVCAVGQTPAVADMRASPGDISILRHTIDSLREAFLKFADTVRMDAVTRIAGIATIDDYSQRWANWPWPSSSKDNDFIRSQDLARASGIVTDSLGPNSGVLVEWFTLGSLLPEGDWQGFPRESSCKWEWKWPDRIQRFVQCSKL